MRTPHQIPIVQVTNPASHKAHQNEVVKFNYTYKIIYSSAQLYTNAVLAAVKINQDVTQRKIPFS